MNIINVKGFRFHPTDEELIEYLQDKTFDRDSLVQFITQVPDICEFEPRELPERSALQTGDRLWYFMYPTKYKYRNSKRISRTTAEGYWKPTGNARNIINHYTGELIGTKKTLVFYKGQCNDTNKTKTGWVMHEYELAAAKPADSNQITFNLCKLKKKGDISSDEARLSSQHSLSNLEYHIARNAVSEYMLGLKGLIEPDASNGSDGLHDQSSSSESYAGGRSNQHNIVNDDDKGFKSINQVAEEAIPQDQLLLREVSTEGTKPDRNDGVQNPYSTNEEDDESCNSILTDDDKMIPIERSNQHNVVVAAEGFQVPSNFERSNQHNVVVAAEGFQKPSNLDFLANEDLIPTDLLYHAFDELLAEPEATNNSDWIQNQEGNRQHYLAAETEGFGILMEKSRKRPRLDFDKLSHDVETGEA